MQGKIRVIIVDDSSLVREILQVVLSLDNDIEVVGHAKNGKEAIDLASTLRPDVITMDISMPEMDGIDAIEHIMAYHPTPIMVLTSLSDAGLAFRSLSKGALEVVEKPELDDDKCREFVKQIKQLSKVKVITHISGRLKRGRERTPVAEPPPKEETLKKGIPGRIIQPEKKVVAIGSSTGGLKYWATSSAPFQGTSRRGSSSFSTFQMGLWAHWWIGLMTSRRFGSKRPRMERRCFLASHILRRPACIWRCPREGSRWTTVHLWGANARRRIFCSHRWRGNMDRGVSG